MKKLFTIIIISMIVVTGCGESLQNSGDIALTEKPAMEADEEADIKESEVKLAVEEAEVKEANVSEIAQKYAYSRLEEDEQVIYKEVLKALTNMEVESPVSTIQPEILEKAFLCVMNDYPGLFYVEGYTFTKYTVDGKIEKITFSGTYTMTAQQKVENQLKIDAYVQQCLEGISDTTDEYEIVKYIYEYLAQHTEYDMQAEDNQNICSVFLNGRSVCQGYAKAMQYLLDQTDVFSTLVTGTVKNGTGHAWNLVEIENEYYYTDVTWGDAYYIFEENEYNYEEGTMPQINYDYLCVTTEEIKNTHVISNVVPLPECTSMVANYYVKEGAYFTDLDMDKIEALFAKAYEQNEKMVTLKCANETVYNSLSNELLTNQKIFQYIQGEKKVAYAENASWLSISFWL